MPLEPLPSILRDDFNENLHAEQWPEVYGAERGTLSGEPLKSGTALIFKGVRTPSCRDHMTRTLALSRPLSLALSRSCSCSRSLSPYYI